jgi:hypothetical protein
MFGKIAVIVIGLAGVGFGVRALLEGTVNWAWVRFGAWGSINTEFDRDESPLGYWLATMFYLVGGAFLSLFGVFRLLFR